MVTRDGGFLARFFFFFFSYPFSPLLLLHQTYVSLFSLRFPCFLHFKTTIISECSDLHHDTIIQQSHFLPLLWISGKWQLSHKHQLACRCWCQAGEGQPCLQPLCLFLFYANWTHLQKGERKKVHPYSLVFLFFCESLCQYIVNTLSRLFMDHLIHSKTFEF